MQQNHELEQMALAKERSLLLEQQKELLLDRRFLLQERERLLLRRRDLLQTLQECRSVLEHCARWGARSGEPR